MSPAVVAAAAAVASVLVAILGGMAMLIFNAGKHAQRLDVHEQDIRGIKATMEEHGRAISVFHQFAELLKEVRDDVKGLLTGRMPARRRAGED